MRREFPLVIRKTGEKFIPTFPTELNPGDQIIVVREEKGSQVPVGETWILNGYSDRGPIINKK